VVAVHVEVVKTDFKNILKQKKHFWTAKSQVLWNIINAKNSSGFIE
jgi:hypothetical protein